MVRRKEGMGNRKKFMMSMKEDQVLKMEGRVSRKKVGK
jgi:hypothetical protein